jgi:nitroreductase
MNNIFAKRESVRNYLTGPVPKNALDRCLEAARNAPSANNAQPWYFVVAADTEIKGRLARAAGFGLARSNPFAEAAPVIVAVMEGPGHRPTKFGGYVLGRYFPLMDIGMAVENFCLQAAEEGLGTCILGLFSAREVRRALKLPAGRKPRLLITVGRPSSGELRIKKRLPIEEISRYIKGKGIIDASGSE